VPNRGLTWKYTVTLVPVLSVSAQLVTWLAGIAWPSERTRSLTAVARHALGGSDPFCTDSGGDWRCTVSFARPE
jgi:hypothetical protein